MSSSPIRDHSFNSQESPSARPELHRESDRLKLLLDMTNTLVSNLELRDLLRAVSARDRKSTRLNSSHLVISYAVFCLKKKKQSAQRRGRTKRHSTTFATLDQPTAAPGANW